MQAVLGKVETSLKSKTVVDSDSPEATHIDLEHRVLQFKGTRYSIRLEKLYWQVLEDMALQRRIPLRALIHELASQATDQRNLTAALRSIVVSHTIHAKLDLERELELTAISKGSIHLASILESCPTPAMLVSATHTVTEANDAFLKWSNLSQATLKNKPVDRIFDIRAKIPLSGIQQQFAENSSEWFPAKLVFLRPGKIEIVRGIICLARYFSAEDYSYFIFLDVARAT